MSNIFLLALLCIAALINGVAGANSVETDASEEPANSPQPIIADVLWVDYAFENHRLLYSRFDGENWSTPEVVHHSVEPITSPAMATDQQGQQWVVWSQLRRNKISLNYRRREQGQTHWEEPVLLNKDYAENLAASIVIDLDNRIWVFWAASGKQLSDIMFIYSDNGLSWSEPELLHKRNKVPDIHPIASLDQSGNVLVNWSTYSYLQQDYVVASSLIEREYKSTQLFDFFNESGGLEDQVALSDVSLPAFLPNNALSHIHFPSNKMLQSLPVVANVGVEPAL